VNCTRPVDRIPWEPCLLCEFARLPRNRMLSCQAISISTWSPSSGFDAPFSPLVPISQRDSIFLGKTPSISTPIASPFFILSSPDDSTPSSLRHCHQPWQRFGKFSQQLFCCLQPFQRLFWTVFFLLQFLRRNFSLGACQPGFFSVCLGPCTMPAGYCTC
jgi:hypothetical protein